jgi:hypothetical protein
MMGTHRDRASAVVYTALSIPIYGVVVRWRANYTPKSVQLEENETGSQNKVTNVFQMMLQVYRVEVRDRTSSTSSSKSNAMCRVGAVYSKEPVRYCPFHEELRETSHPFTTVLMVATTLLPILFTILTSVMDVDYADVIRPKWRFPEPYQIPLSLAVRALEIALLVPPHILMSVLHIRWVHQIVSSRDNLDL